MKTFIFLLSLAFAATVNTGISQVPNNFKIGFCIDTWSTQNGTIITSTFKDAQKKYYSSAMNVLSQDGVNFIRSYEPDIWISQANYKKYIELCGNNKMMIIDHHEEWFKSKPNDPNGLLGTNVYDMSLIKPDLAYNNYDALYTNIYNNLPYKHYVFGHVLSGESNYDHHRIHEGVFPSGYANDSPSQWSRSKVPPKNLSDANAHFYPLSSTIGQNLLQVQANHSGSISNDPTNTVGFEVSKYLQIQNRGDIYVEGSYSADVWNEWRKPAIPIQYDYLGKYKSIDYAKQYYSKIFAEIDISYAEDYYRGYNWHTNLQIPNGNMTWFQAYNSIVHGATGLILWGVTLSYDPTDPTDILSQSKFTTNNLSVDNYNYNNFSNIYKNCISSLSKELRYLKEKDFLTSENNIIYSKTISADANCILPASTTYLPVNVNPHEGKDMTTFFAIKGYTDNPTLYNYHRTEDFGIRYSIRTNGNEVIMIATNPNPYCVRQVKFNFTNIANPIIKNATGVDVLFEENNNQGVSSTNYKVNRNWISRSTFKDNITSNVPAITSAMRKYTVNFNSISDKSFFADFGPLDVHVYKFTGNVNNTNYDTYWKKSWTNNGDGNIAWGSIYDIDKRIMGDFTGDGNCDLLTLQGLNNGSWGYLVGYKKATSSSIAQLNNWLWCNNDHEGLQHIKWWKLGAKDKYVAGDFNADGIDELLCLQGENTGGWAAMIGFNKTSGKWDNWYWCNNDHEGLGHINLWNMGANDKYVSGDFDGDGRDELFCLQSQNSGIEAALIGYNKNTNLWDNWLWSNNGNSIIKWWGFSATDRPLIGDFNGDGKDELLLIQSLNSGAWSAMLGFNKITGLWDNWYWCNNDHEGLGKISTWQIKTTDKFVVGDFDGNGREDLLCIQSGVGASLTKLLTYNNGWSVLWESTDQRLHDWYISDGVDADYLPFKQKNSFNQNITGVLCTRKYACDKYLVSLYQLSSTSFRSTSTESYEDTTISIYPNPSSGLVNFTFANEINKKIFVQVDDYLGRTVYQNHFTNAFNQIDLSLQPNGIYFVKARINNIVSVKKIIINK